MTDIEKQALALVNEVLAERHEVLHELLERDWSCWTAALVRAIEQHEAFRQEVSDGLTAYQSAASNQQRENIWDALTRFIIAKPDPLEDVMQELVNYSRTIDAEAIRAALAARGLKIVEVGHD